MAEMMNEIRHALRRGSCFHDGKYRIAAMFERETDEKTLAKYLANEYGTGGHSHTYLDGSRGFVDYDGRGIRMTRKGFSEEYAFLTWSKAVRIIRWMIDNTAYLDQQERLRYAVRKAEYMAALPAAAPEPDQEGSAEDDAPDYEQLTFADLLGGF